MTETLQDRLRAVEGDGPDEGGTRWYRNPDGPEAADALDAAEAENARLREALRDIAEGRGMHGVNTGTDLIWATEHARAALRDEGEGEG